jgi:hypothetical protein
MLWTGCKARTMIVMMMAITPSLNASSRLLLIKHMYYLPLTKREENMA